jgi:hypothetical protein
VLGDVGRTAQPLPPHAQALQRRQLAQRWQERPKARGGEQVAAQVHILRPLPQTQQGGLIHRNLKTSKIPFFGGVMERNKTGSSKRNTVYRSGRDAGRTMWAQSHWQAFQGDLTYPLLSQSAPVFFTPHSTSPGDLHTI